MFLHSQFQQVDVSLKDAQVSQSAGTYAYRAYIESLLSYGPQAKTSQLTAALYYKDTACNIDRSNPDHANAGERNYGLQTRASFRVRGVIVDMISCIHSDIFFQDRYMPNEVNVKVRLVRNKDSFCLMCGEANPSYKISSSAQSCWSARCS